MKKRKSTNQRSDTPSTRFVSVRWLSDANNAHLNSILFQVLTESFVFGIYNVVRRGLHQENHHECTGNGKATTNQE